MGVQPTRSIGLFVSCLMLAACNGDQTLVGPIPTAAQREAQSPESTANLAQSAGDSSGIQYAYVSNFDSNNVYVYAVNPNSGALKLLGSVGETGAGPEPVAIDPTGKFAYVADYNSDDISAFAIKVSSGALTPIVGSPFETGTNPSFVVIDPTGKFAYAPNAGSSSVSAYTINASSGALTLVPGSPFATGVGPYALAIDPNGKFVYVSLQGGSGSEGSVSAYSVNTSSGALTPVPGSPFEAGDVPSAVAIAPSGKFAYVGNYKSNNVSAYRIESNGSLAQLKGSPFAAGESPYSAIIDPTGSFLYVGNSGADTLSAYVINATSGALTPVAGSPFATGTNPQEEAIDSSGKFIYVANFGASGSNGNVSAYKIERGGALMPVKGSPFSAGQGPSGVSICGRVGRKCVPPAITF